MRYGIIYEDEWLIVIDKPSGLLVIPTPSGEQNTLSSLLNSELDRRGVKANAYPCHRLDRDTSGLIVYAKGKAAQRLMMEEFKHKRVKKSYIAFVQGTVKKDRDIIRSFIYNKKKGRNEPAQTDYRVIERRRGYTVLEAEPITGRTNQIRIHFKNIGHPLVGEDVYAFRKDFDLRFRRVALHARYIRFTHPITKKKMEFELALPEDMENFLRRENK